MAWIESASFLLNFLTIVMAPIIVIYGFTAFAVSRERKSGMLLYICALALLLGVAAVGHAIGPCGTVGYDLLHDAAMFAAMAVLALGLRQYIHGVIASARESGARPRRKR